MKITIETIPHDQQRYETIGDWLFDGDDLHIKVSALGDARMEALVGIHELIEALVCDKAGIAEADVSAFDIAHPELDDPGGDRRAPYHTQHVFAECIERLIAQELGVNWGDYDTRVQAL
jgi:hypothetical protein